MRVIDTSVLIDYFRGVPAAKTLICDEEPVVSMVSIHEIYSGLKYANSHVEQNFFDELFMNIVLLDYTRRAAEESSSLAALLRINGITINALDLMIAGTAIANNIAEIASKDSHFKEIEKYSKLAILSY